MAETINLGIVGIKNMGEYSSQTNYEKLNVVTYNGSTYCALRDTLGNLPTNTDYWQLYAEKGGKGDTGDTGPQGPKPVKGVDYYTAEDIAELELTLSNDVSDEVTEQLSDLTSATPLAASSIAGMTDTTRIYVNTTDGHWYWYDGDSWEDGGVYQATAIGSDSITSSMLKNDAVTYHKIGDKNLLAIEDYFKQNNIFITDTDKLTDTTTANPTSQITTEVNGGFSYSWALPFKYDENKKYKYIYIPYLKINSDAYLTFSICSTSLTGNITQISNYEITKTKYYITAGTYYDLLIPLSDMNYSLLTNNTEYYFVLYSLQDEDTITYNSLNQMIMKRKNTDAMGSFIDTTNNDVKYIANSSVWPFSTLGSNFYNAVIPRFSLCLENPLTLDLVNFIRITANVTKKLNGKTVNFMGDSITQGSGGDIGGSVVDHPYPSIIEDNTGCNSNNYGIAGSTLSGDGSTHNTVNDAIIGFQPMCNRLNLMSSSADVNIIFGGTNDALADRQVPLGEFGDTTNLTFYGGLDIICKYLLNNFPKKTNLFIVPLQRHSQNTGNIYGKKLIDYVNAIKEVAGSYGLPVLDLYHNGGGTPLNSTWKTNNMPDGTHPNQSYYYDLANKIEDFINNQI